MTATVLPTITTYPILVDPLIGARPTDLDYSLNHAQQLLESADPNAAMHAIRIVRDSASILRRACLNPANWRRIVDDRVRTHPVLAMIHEDPFVHRAFQKPRGYAGDAVLLDFIYHHPDNLPQLERATPRGRAATGFSTNAPAPRGVCNRAWLLAHEIDALCRRTARAEILSLACGHLREAGRSQAIRDRATGRFVALDQDAGSLAVVRRDLDHAGVHAVEGSVRSVIAHGKDLGRFDFVYAAGLYDYLNDKVGARLLRALFDLLKPGGKLWVANFLPAIVDAGFMEAFMDWWPIYRTPRQLEALATTLPAEAVAWRRTFTEHEDNVVFLEIGKHA